MKLLLDIGNSRIKWAWLDERGRLSGFGGIDHRSAAIDEIANANWSDWPGPEQILVSSVAAEARWRKLSDWCLQHWRQTPLRVVSVASQCGVMNAYTQPHELGSDRWAAMIGAHHLLHADTCIIDCGTAITIDFLEASGRHLGGYIIPGLSLMQRSLAQGTAVNPASSSPGRAIENSISVGYSTAACIEQGVLLAAASLIESSSEKMKMRTGRSFAYLFTGGDAEVVSAASVNDAECRFEPHLVLLGLAQIEKEIVKSSKQES